MAGKRDDDRVTEEDRNQDPITGQPGAHPVGAGLGAAAGGAAAGAAAGAVGGPVGAAVGAVVGGVAGGLAGKAAGEAVNPTEEEEYWRQNYKTRDYVASGEDFDTYRPAYGYGVQSATRHVGRTFDEVESQIQSEWNRSQHASTLDWKRARPAVRDAYTRACSCLASQTGTPGTPHR